MENEKMRKHTTIIEMSLDVSVLETCSSSEVCLHPTINILAQYNTINIHINRPVNYTNTIIILADYNIILYWQTSPQYRWKSIGDRL